jgi:hypothetical protein
LAEDGKVGPKSQARYISQHYNAASARSTLAASLIHDARMASVTGFSTAMPGDWIMRATCRVNILVPMQMGPALLSLLEAFLHVRLNPIYEG